MEVRGGGVAGAGPAASARAGVTKAIVERLSLTPEADAGRRAESRAVDGAGTAACWGASSRQADQDGPLDGAASASPWQRPASQQAIFTGQ
jgi:hypothetical protein